MRVLLSLPLLMMVGCASAPPARPAGGCSSGAEELAAIAPANILGVEPYVHVVTHQRGDVDRELRGASLLVRAQPGVTREWLQQALECHGDQIAGGAVAVAVESAGDAFRADLVSARDGARVLASARSYASR